MLTVAVAATVLVAGCGSSQPATRTKPSTTGAAVAAPTATGVLATAAVVRDPKTPVTVYRDHTVDAPVVTKVPGRTRFGTAAAFAVQDARPGWVQVSLPVRPNGSSGWVKSGAVTVYEVQSVITVDRDRRTITVDVGDGHPITEPAGVGSRDNPTPPGAYYVTDLVTSTEPGYGTFALGVSAHSSTLTEFAGQDGQIGIHGTSDPSSVGRAVTHGCVRVSSTLDAKLAAWTRSGMLKIGTPVNIL
jgi:lipoprotein-anchoring transpeptidase ErfK/SrfK